jgi:hypothetical protein
MKGYVDSPKFIQDLDSISTFLDNDIITAGDIAKFPYLKNIFTPEVLSEASLLGRGRSGSGMMSVSGKYSSVINPDTRQEFKSEFEIVQYLTKKYAAELGKGISSDQYKKEYANLMQQFKQSKKTPKYSQRTQVAQSQRVQGFQTQEKESDAALGRLNNFVKNFVYKIDAGGKTNEVRSFIVDAIKKKIQQHKPAPKEQPEVQAQAQGVVQQQVIKPILHKESFIRREIRNILEGLL